ncbi:MAG: hypothetical protein AB8A46_02010 [Prochlorococcus sp.]|nr:hypothetical protein [Prochlorococcus sp.]MDP6193343.1 hypothetical protein [Prochlorococcaceae cyanobacterium ETNP18_MAG_1]
MALRFSAPASSRCQISIAIGFLSAFVIGSLAIQLWRSHDTAPTPSAASKIVEPVTTHQATLWQTLGQP